MLGLCLSSTRTSRGTIREMSTIADVVAGATVVCTNTTTYATKGKEYTVLSVSPSRVELEGYGRKWGMKPLDFLQSFERRLGPVMECSIRRGLSAKSTMEGSTYKKDEVLTLTEAGGTVYDCKNSKGRKCRVEKQELLTAFIYV